MAEAIEIPYHELAHVSGWYLREETIRRAIVALVDYHHSLPLSSAFGPGSMAMSDGIRFEVSSKVLYAQYHSRHFGPRWGVTLHDMTSDQYSQPYIQIITPHMREAHAALDALLHHETELPLREMIVDTAGFTDLMYALYELEGFSLSPRIRDLPTLRLFPLARPDMQAALDHLCTTGYPVQESDVEHLSPILSAHINLHGSHHFDFQVPRKRQGQLRPLRIRDPL